MIRTFFTAIFLLSVVCAQPDIAQISVVPRSGAFGVVVSIAGPAPAAGTKLFISATTGSGNATVLLLAQKVSVLGNVVDAGVLLSDPGEIVRFAAATENAYATHPMQRFVVDTTEAVYISALVWVANGTGFTLDAIPTSKLPARARWSARCEGVPDVLGRKWDDRTVTADSVKNCVAAVTTDAAGFVTTDPMPVHQSTDVYTSGSIRAIPHLAAASIAALLAMNTIRE